MLHVLNNIMFAMNECTPVNKSNPHRLTVFIPSVLSSMLYDIC